MLHKPHKIQLNTDTQMSLQKDRAICKTNESDGSDSKMKVTEKLYEVKTRKAIKLNEMKGKIKKLDKQKLAISAAKIVVQSPKENDIDGGLQTVKVETEKSLYTMSET